MQRREPVRPARSAPPPAASPVSGKPLVVQVAAFSAQDRADKVAAALGGKVGKPGKFWLVRIGPFTSQAEAEAALAKARAGGYKDARILRAE